MSAQVVPFVRKLKTAHVPKDEVYFEMPAEMVDQVMALSKVFIANADLLAIGKFDDYYKCIAMFMHPRYPGRMLVDVSLPEGVGVRGCFCANPVTHRLEKLLDKPLMHFV